MKIQDILFFIILVIVLIYKKGQYTWHTGIICFALSGILFFLDNLFTSQRFSWYGAGFIALYTIRSVIFYSRKN